MLPTINFLNQCLGLYINPVVNLILPKEQNKVGWRELKEGDVENFLPGITYGSYFNRFTGETSLTDPNRPVVTRSGFKLGKLFKYIIGALLLSFFWFSGPLVRGRSINVVPYLKNAFLIGSAVGIVFSFQKEKREILVISVQAIPRFFN